MMTKTVSTNLITLPEGVANGRIPGIVFIFPPSISPQEGDNRIRVIAEAPLDLS